MTSSATRIVLAAVAVVSACGDNAEVDISGLGISELAVNSPDGYVRFYIGKRVLEEVALTGTFVPDDEEDSYDMIRVPAARIDGVRETGPVTLTLCDGENDIYIFHNGVADIYQSDPPDSTNCTPNVTRYDGRMTIAWESGWQGLYGFVRIATLDNGNLTVGAHVADRMPSACADDPSHDQSNAWLGNFALLVEAPIDCQAPNE